jgi:hypothetical protein
VSADGTKVSAIVLRPVRRTALAGGVTRWARTVAEAELLVRRFAACIPPGEVPEPIELAVLFAGGASVGAEIALHLEDAHREASPLEEVLLGWAHREHVAGRRARATDLGQMAELVRHVAHHRTIGERVDVHESRAHSVDANGAAEVAATRARVLARPPPAPLVGSRYRDGRLLTEIATDVHRDIQVAVSRGLLPGGLRCAVRVERFEAGRGLELEVLDAPGLWIPDVCEVCLPVALGIEPRTVGPLYCGHTPVLGGDSLAAQGVLLTLMALADLYNWDAGWVEGERYAVESAFQVATCFGPHVGKAQREGLRLSEAAFRSRLRADAQHETERAVVAPLAAIEAWL